MKKIIALLLVLTLSIGLLAGCAEETKKGPTLADAMDYLTASCSIDDGKMTPADYRLIGQVLIDGVVFEVTWTASLEIIKLTKDGKFVAVDVPEKNETETTYTLTATVKDAQGNTDTKTFSRVLPVYDNTGAVTAPVEGEAYKIFMVHANLGQTLFATTNTQKENGVDKYIKTDADPKKGADFFVEKVGEGYKFYTMIDGVKNYIHASLVEKEGGKFSKHIGFATETDCVYTYHADVNAWFVTLNSADYVVGTYNTFDTICISEATHISPENTGVSQFVIAFVPKATGEAMVPTVDTRFDPTGKSVDEILEAAYALADGNSFAKPCTLTGKITEIKDAYSEQYGNITVVIAVEGKEDKPIIAFRLKGDGAESLAVGDVISVTGTIKNYQSDIEFDSGCTFVKAGMSAADIVDAAYALAPGATLGTQTLTGKVTEITDAYSEQYNNITLTIAVEGKEDKPIVCFRIKGDAAPTVKVGDVITVTGELLNYSKDGTNGTIEFNSGCTFVIAGASTDTPDVPVVGADTSYITAAPEAGKTYKLGLFQEAKNINLYFDGNIYKTYAWYMNGVEDKAAAMAVTIEAVEGGFRMFFMKDGAKTYLDAHIDGTHYSLRLTTEPTAVWTWDAEMNTFVVDLDGTKCFIGTSGSYTSISCNKVENVEDSYVAHLFA